MFRKQDASKPAESIELRFPLPYRAALTAVAVLFGAPLIVFISLVMAPTDWPSWMGVALGSGYVFCGLSTLSLIMRWGLREATIPQDDWEGRFRDSSDVVSTGFGKTEALERANAFKGVAQGSNEVDGAWRTMPFDEGEGKRMDNMGQGIGKLQPIGIPFSHAIPDSFEKPSFMESTDQSVAGEQIDTYLLDRDHNSPFQNEISETSPSTDYRNHDPLDYRDHRHAKRGQGLESSPSYHPPQRGYGKKGDHAQDVLYRCLEKAQLITGLHHLQARTGRLKNLTLDPYALDLRRLFDRLRAETGAPIVLYSKVERRLLFANDQIPTFFEWPKERFVKDFIGLIKGGRIDWEEAMGNMLHGKEIVMRLVIRSRSGENLLVQSCWGEILSGSFRGLVVGVFSG